MKHVLALFSAASVIAFAGLSAQASPSARWHAQGHKIPPLALQAPQSFQALHKNGIVGTWLASYDGGFHSAFAQYQKAGTTSQMVDFAAKTGNALLGDWKGNDDGSISVFLTGWTYDDAGDNLIGYFTKSETDTVSGGSYTGTFEVTFYDLQGNIEFQHDGTLTATRVGQ
jgi:hypothetical protein